MKLKAHKVIVVRDETTRIGKEVWEWELPILDAVHPEGFVIQTGEIIEVERTELPNPAAEYDRLTRIYKQDESGRDFTELVYGFRQKGVSELAELIEAAVVGASKRKPRKAAEKAVASPVDPLGDD